MDSDVWSVSGEARDSSAGSVERIPDVVLRVLPDTRVVEVQVTRSSAPPAPAVDEEHAELAEQMAMLVDVVRDRKKPAEVDAGPDFARSLEPRALGELLPEEGAALVNDWVSRAFERDAPVEGTYRVAEQDAPPRTFHVTVQPSESDGIVTIRDITVTEESDLVQHALDTGALALRYLPRVGPDGSIEAAHGVVRHVDANQPLAVADIGGPLRAAIDEWVVHAASRHISGAASIGVRLPLSVDVSRHFLHRQGALEVLSGFLECYGADPGLLELRADEEAWFGRGAGDVAEDVRTLGCRVVLMDALPERMRVNPPTVDGWAVPAQRIAAIHFWAEVRDLAEGLGIAVVVTDTKHSDDRAALAKLGFGCFEGACFGAAKDGRPFLRALKDQKGA